ncbi:MAG TPA: sodium:proton antiporter, partial [Pirellulaceae bacterium]
MSESHRTPRELPVILVILGVVLAYALWLTSLLPARNSASEATGEATSGQTQPSPTPHKPRTTILHAHREAPHPLAILPFVLLLLGIAVFPLSRWTAHWWESNLHRFYVALTLAIVTLAYYGLWAAHGGWERVGGVVRHALWDEYLPFITLLFALYTISGGIHISGDLQATPTINTIYLAIGALLASFIGTTGAAMLLIRPLLQTNSERKHVQHTVVFFIFCVCNCGGCLLPIGDPPLLLGYLRGIPFLWTLRHLWEPWLFVNLALLATYFLLDKWVYHPRERSRDIARDESRVERIRVVGWQPNLWLLVGVVLAVAFLDPAKPLPGTNWYPWPCLREVVQLVLVAFSLAWGDRAARVTNHFNYSAILEVAILFVGIFICMQPALELLGAKGQSLGMNRPEQYFWYT